MIGVLITTHGNLGSEMIKAAEMIRGKIKGIIPISVDQTKGVEELRREIGTAIKKLDQGHGVLILTDLFGGTPSNISLSFMKDGKVEVITGLNLPMLLKMPDIREGVSLKDFAQNVKAYGMKNISLASEILNTKVAR